ncbi:MAG TPA: aldehyde dehydrogenase family protein [Microvirga sp.]|nr:aldehyde dehydrogenase family protein [Microvirga sp.]
MTAPSRSETNHHPYGTTQPMLLAGEWVTSDEIAEVRDPEDGALVGLVSHARTQDAVRALDFAARARTTAAAMASHQRATILSKAASIVEAEAESFAILIASEGIKTIREARAEVARCVITFRLSADAAQRVTGETIAFDQRPGSERRTGYYTREPLGVVLAITPFNDPLNLVAHKVGPAVASGNAVILKPHEQTPLTALKLADVLLRAGLPPPVLQVLPGRGHEIGPLLLRDDRIRLVSFTGGYETGQRIAATAGLKRLEMELGSNCPTIVLGDADIERASRSIVSGAFWAAGQNCLHVQRVLAERSIAGELRDRLVALTEQVLVGEKRSSATDMGCLVSEAAAHRIERSVASAGAAGALLLTGGKRQGARFAPTLIEQVPDDHPIARDEVYGPVTVLREVGCLDDAINVANATSFGLQAAIFTRDLEHAHRAVRELEVGAVMVNESSDYRMDGMPFGGVKASGLGREGVQASILAMTEPKVACFTY